MCKLPEPTQALLLQAVYASWRPHWPGYPHNPQACLDHPVYGPCMRTLARRLALKLARGLLPTRPAPAAPSAPAIAPRWHIPTGAFDARRAAANDRDDD